MNIKPLFDKVVVEDVEHVEEVIDGKEVTMQVKVGDKVLCSKYAGTDFKVDGKEFTIIKQSDILAVVED